MGQRWLGTERLQDEETGNANNTINNNNPTNTNEIPIENNSNENITLMFGGDIIQELTFDELHLEDINFLLENQINPNASTVADNRNNFTPFVIKDTLIIRNDLNLQKQSLQFKPIIDEDYNPNISSSSSYYTSTPNNEESINNNTTVNSTFILQFKFDVRTSFVTSCGIHIYFKAKESKINNNKTLIYETDFILPVEQFSIEDKCDHSNDCTTTLLYESSTNNPINLNEIFKDKQEAIYSGDINKIPLVIELRSEHNTQISFCSIEQRDQNYFIQVNTQKVIVNNEMYEVAEIYGQNHHQNENVNSNMPSSDEDSLCVICMSEEANTCSIPCRHMAMCFNCANALKEQSNKCPICRQTISSIIKLN
ncbi:hypothetical protein ABK040_010315 [Willaertia magna]